MNLKISTNIAGFRNVLEAKATKLEQAARNVVVTGTRAILATSQVELRRQVYDQPIPKRSSGKDAWERSGNLLRQERASFPGRFQGVVSNQAPYAQARHELNRPSPTDGQTRRAPWRRTAAHEAEPQVVKMAEEAVEKVLE